MASRNTNGYTVSSGRFCHAVTRCIFMESTPKEMLKAYVDSQKFSSTTEIMDAMKEMFRAR